MWKIAEMGEKQMPFESVMNKLFIFSSPLSIPPLSPGGKSFPAWVSVLISTIFASQFILHFSLLGGFKFQERKNADANEENEADTKVW